ncbi:MAG: glycosyl hydrolase family 8 [Thermodesulfobacteriota bacterium]
MNRIVLSHPLVTIPLLAAAFWLLPSPLPLAAAPAGKSHALVNSLHELWSFYKYTYIREGRVISLDENNITTSEGQGYALLRAVWSNDHRTFKQVYQWTRENLMVRGDHLFAWKWKQDRNSATDADTDIALALLLAAEKFSTAAYRDDARRIIQDIWRNEVIRLQDKYYPTAGNWSLQEAFPTVHVAYLAPYAYELFAEVDEEHPWKELVVSSYEILEWIFLQEKLPLPPEIVYLDRKTGKPTLMKPGKGRKADFSYDAFPIYWRVAVDDYWHGRNKTELIGRMLAFWKSEWQNRRRFDDRYTIDGKSKSRFEALPLYATVRSLAAIGDPDLARQLSEHKLGELWRKARAGKDTPYYLHNWLWFDRALQVHVARDLTDFFDFLKPFDFRGFRSHFPLHLSMACLALFLLSRWEGLDRYAFFKAGFLITGFALCLRYLNWRVACSLNFLEALGPFISISLLAAEFYCLSTVFLLLLQVGLKKRKRELPQQPENYCPSVDVYIPIYSESLDILEKTLLAACSMGYRNKNVFVLDDSHRQEVAALAGSCGARYIKGPKQHAKAGNLNNALSLTGGELVVVFDTDHIPVASFLDETVPFFQNSEVGVVQTPHHFYNPDIFQRAFHCEGLIPNEQDMFNHGIQGGRDGWKGAFFVGSGAVFRRSALEHIGGFQLMSITEDIHSSQHLHARGYESVFVDKDLAVGLTAENYSSYIVQRRRWMQGCLQIFFRDNPLVRKGLGLRHRFGYFASLYYFFFPVVRVIFWITPLYYLLFHLHPILADVSVLLAYMLPYMICLPLLSGALLRKWPRMFWGVIYEKAVCFPLFLSMFSLLLPGSLGFKVTPKGIVSDRRRFDFSSSAVTLLMAVINAVAIIKGVAEFYYFEIEKDAYLFNLGWAVYNMLLLSAALLVAWERPQRRASDRLRVSIPFTLTSGGVSLSAATSDISLTGLSFRTGPEDRIPGAVELTLFAAEPLRIPARLVYHDREKGGRSRCGFCFQFRDPGDRNQLLLRTFADPATWEDVHGEHTRSNLLMGFYFIRGIFSCFSSSMVLKRSEVRYKSLTFMRLANGRRRVAALLRNRSAAGRGFLVFTPAIQGNEKWMLGNQEAGTMEMELVYQQKMAPLVFRVGFRLKEGS